MSGCNGYLQNMYLQVGAK
ncbi:hypothetical protein EYZ11_011766 [Aspergillus tanneri]|uniref:Uncharacterized protein n=1 Tax=Aspergillus tanneri TaxID=1220188 RepID=A0A4S3J433_9EURO|nr:hypothetical protein EYZ11_011766 [Aspergillus tanneri]